MSHKRPTLTKLANTYVTLEEAEVYFSERANHIAWDDTRPEEQMRLLITVSRLISLQVLDAFKLGTITTVSTLLLQGTCELALSAAASSDVLTQATDGSNVKKVKADTVEVEFFRPVAGQTFPSLVMEILREAEVLETPSTESVFATGTDGVTVFDECNRYGKNEGFF